MDTNAEVERQDGWFQVYVASNAMEAYLELKSPQGDGKWPDKNDALAALRKENIIYGIHEEAIDSILERRFLEKVLVAEGKAAEPGKDANIHLLFRTDPASAFVALDNEAAVDYKNIETIQSVRTGQVIAQKIPPTEGVPGMNVCGKQLDPSPGKDQPLKLGKNVVWTDDNLQVVSKIDGEPSYLSNQLSVYPVHELNGDVDLKSGNISFAGSLVIRGNVDSGFRVEAEGDITVQGSIEAAEIKAGGNILVRGGVTGMGKCTIACNGDFTAKYIESAKVDCCGTVTAKEVIMHCEINADKRVIADTGKGLIVGGIIRSGEDISAKTIGSIFGTATELEAGVKPKLKIEFRQLEEMIPVNKENLDKSEKAIVILERIPHLPPDRQAMHDNLRKTIAYLHNWLDEAEVRRKAIRDEMLVLSKGRGKISIREKLYPGIKATIAGATIVVRDEYNSLTMVYSEGEVKFIAYR